MSCNFRNKVNLKVLVQLYIHSEFIVIIVIRIRFSVYRKRINKSPTQ